MRCRLIASALTDVIVENLSGHFDVEKLVTCNLLKLGRFVVDSFENTFDFCSELKLINALHSAHANTVVVVL